MSWRSDLGAQALHDTSYARSQRFPHLVRLSVGSSLHWIFADSSTHTFGSVALASCPIRNRRASGETCAVTRLAGPPRWAIVATHVAALTPVPSGLWRFTLAFGMLAGYTEQGYADLNMSGWGAPYVIVLSVGTECAAVLTLGLVRPWGEVVPRWIPVLGGRAVNARSATVAASLGAAILIVLWTPFIFWWQLPHDDMTPTGSMLVGILYVPMVLWAPLLIAVTVSYWRRHRLHEQRVAELERP